MYKYNSKDVLNMFRGGSLIYNAEQEVCLRLFSGNTPGFWYDPNDLDDAKLKWRRNLFTETEFRNGLLDAPVRGGAVSATTFSGLNLNTGIRLATVGAGAYAYKTYSPKHNVRYVFSAYVRMEDGSVPVIGQGGAASGPGVDFCVVARGDTIALNNLVMTDLGGGLYKVVGKSAFTGTSSHFGFVKYLENSARPFIVSGYQVEEALEGTAYQPFTDFSSEFIAAFPNHALYQDASGTVPVSLSGQPTGLMLDKSKGLALGPEKFIEADITISGESQKINSTTYRIYSSAGVASGVQLTNKLTANRMYLVEFTIESFAIVGDGLAAESIGGTTLAHKTVGRKRVFITPLTTTFFLKRSGICDAIVKDITVKEIAGSHAFQATSSLKPIFRQTPILGSELVSNGTFNTNILSWAANNGASLSYSSGRAKITATVDGNSQISQDILNIAGMTVEINVDFYSKVSNASVSLLLWDGTSNYGLVSGTSVSGSLKSTVTLPPTFSGRVIFKFNSALSGDSVEVDNISVRQVTGYYSDRNYLEFDGIDDYLQTNPIDLTTTDKISLFTGIRKLSDASVGMVAELSTNTNTNNGSFFIAAPRSPIQNVGFLTRGSSQTAADFNDVPSPYSTVLSTKMSISTDLTQLRENGRSTTSNVDLGTGNLGNYPLYLGRRSGTALPFNGYLYNLIGVGNLVSDADTVLLEKLMALKTGVTLSA